jgi:uncharacterized damage-inducible protein DinB
MSDDLRYPVGEFMPQTDVDPAAIDSALADIADLPEHLEAAVAGLSDEQLDTPYRDGGWTVRQVAHHLVDSHVNAYVRMKLAATEDNPAIKTYDEKRWAELPDASSAPIELALPLLAALHARWAGWLRTLNAVDRARTVRHPDWGTVSIDLLIQLYAWHCRHHVAHITSLRRRQGWT